MGYMDDTPKYKDANIEWLYSHSKANVGDSGTHGLDDPYSGASAMQGEQSEDLATQVLRDREIWTISIYVKKKKYIYIYIYIYIKLYICKFCS